MKLPFLDHSNWPISKEPEERVVNPSYDKQIEDDLMDRLLIALEKHDASSFKDTIQALIQHIKSSEG
jgi:hypothetical protein